MLDESMSSNSSQSQLARRGFVPVLMLLVVVCGTFNAITGKIRAVALGEYSGMLSNLGFQVVYFLIYALVLAINAWSRRVPQEQWHWILIPRESAGFDGFIKGTCDFMKRLPGMKFAALAGILEATANYLIFSTQGYLSVSMYKLLQQFTVPSTLLWSVIFLRARYIFQELLAVVLVVLIAVVAIVVPNDEEKSNSSNGGVSASVLLGLAMILLSCSFVIKELMFLEYKTYAKLKNYEVTDLNIFLMCTSTNFVGVIFVIPISFCLEIATGQDDVGGIVSRGLSFLLADSIAMVSFTVSVIVSTFFNISLFYLIAYASSALAFLCVTITLPAAVILSLVDWPLIGSSSVPWIQWLALLFMLVGIITFRHGNRVHASLEAQQGGCRRGQICCWPLRWLSHH